MTVHYPFHPLHDGELQVIRKTRLGDGALVVVDPSGMPLKIPVWMVHPEAREFELSSVPEISGRALLEVAGLLGASFPAARSGSLSETGASPGKRGAGETARVRVRPGADPPDGTQA